ncbi:hypothetical protein [Bradyrhizobium elkanii]|uniref:hypothetical protein n=1 Tax=Bradyrhizobium elkanii TaxID=29448 RepID=UPI003D1AF87F
MSRRRPGARVGDLVRSRSQEIIIETDDDLAVLELWAKLQRLTIGRSRGIEPSSAANRGVLIDLGLGKLANQSFNLANERRRSRMTQQQCEPLALALRPLLTQQADVMLHVVPRHRLAAAVRCLRAIRIVEIEHGGLHEYVAAALCRRMVRIAVQLGWPTGIGRHNDRLGIAIQRHRRRQGARRREG